MLCLSGVAHNSSDITVKPKNINPLCDLKQLMVEMNKQNKSCQGCGAFRSLRERRNENSISLNGTMSVSAISLKSVP